MSLFLLLGCPPGDDHSSTTDDSDSAVTVCEGFVDEDWEIVRTTLDGVDIELLGDAGHLGPAIPAVTLMGGFNADQAPSTLPERLPVGHGLIQVRVDLPGGADGEDDDDESDLYGPASRRAVAEALQFSSGARSDDAGCAIRDYFVTAETDALVLFGRSNGGNLAVATLVDPDAGAPEVGALVAWETPAGPQFVLDELVLPETRDCTLRPGEGLVCKVDFTQLKWDGRPWLDRNDDGIDDDDEPTFEGLLLDEGRIHSPFLTEAIGEQAGVLSVEDSRSWFELRNASTLAEDTPESLAVMVLGSQKDHVQVLPYAPHVIGLGLAFQEAGHWVRLNPDSAYTGVEYENVAGDGLSFEEPGWLAPEDLVPGTLIGAGIQEMGLRLLEDDWSDDR